MIPLITTVILLTLLYLIDTRRASQPQPVKVPIRVEFYRRIRQR